MVEHRHVGVGVVEVVGVGWVVLLGPVGRQRTIQVEDVVLGFGLVINAVKTHHLAEKGAELEDARLSGPLQTPLTTADSA